LGVLGVVFGGFGCGVWGAAPPPQTPNPQSPIPNPQFYIIIFNCYKINLFKFKNK